MKSLTTEEIRHKFMNFFLSHDHKFVEQSGILPVNDPTLLFINSGMAPMKSFFLGKKQPPYHHLTNIQDCIRTVDIDDVGDSYHASSFRMMGSWSFGSYFKEKAIELAFELITQGFGFPVDRLYATVMRQDKSLPNVPADTESAVIWEHFLPQDRIVWLPPQDNFWGPAGDSGPCGPCTEVFFDRGEEYGKGQEGILVKGRHIEIWNAGVFMQYNMNINREIEPLPVKCVDTGAGLERFAMVLQGTTSIHNIDQYANAYSMIKSLITDERWTRIILDHLKTAVLMLREEISPGNQRHEYVLRRLIRRALSGMYLRNVDMKIALQFIQSLAEVIDNSKLTQSKMPSITNALQIEIEQFQKVLRRAQKHFDIVLGNRQLTVETAFKMKTAHGIPEELIREFCQEHSIEFPDKTFATLMEEHKNISRK